MCLDLVIIKIVAKFYIDTKYWNYANFTLYQTNYFANH
jgi:hypothetical protein